MTPLPIVDICVLELDIVDEGKILVVDEPDDIKLLADAISKHAVNNIRCLIIWRINEYSFIWVTWFSYNI